jgi:small subunit ribosomal protein S5
MPMNNQQNQRRGDNSNNFEEKSEFEEKVISIARVSKKTKGGNNVGFSVLMVVGDRKGQVGLGLGKAKDVASAIKKGIRKAKKKMLTVPLDGTTIPFALTMKRGAGKVMLKPAPTGTGVIAGGPVRAVVEAAGIRDISGKIMGSSNQSSSVYATFAALEHIAKVVKIKNIKLRSIIEIEAEEKDKMQKLQQEAKQHGHQVEEKADAEVAAKKAKAPAAKPMAKPAAKKPAAPKAK